MESFTTGAAAHNDKLGDSIIKTLAEMVVVIRLSSGAALPEARQARSRRLGMVGSQLAVARRCQPYPRHHQHPRPLAFGPCHAHIAAACSSKMRLRAISGPAMLRPSRRGWPHTCRKGHEEHEDHESLSLDAARLRQGNQRAPVPGHNIYTGSIRSLSRPTRSVLTSAPSRATSTACASAPFPRGAHLDRASATDRRPSMLMHGSSIA